ncbi:DUF2550 domain-containing protein [Oceanitalea stevensii]|uniref:DUF2550 domain-containing protein n=1 Tax=Oceanitalea stevensii TaxID=2763072 RepID=A0ABR8Z0B2_9MICO|nr:DUF2550 domain-containing protein [Oceanitalea stevensii]MBD8061411.1 DUF2550 domain-containing protein [Oceanitalea stevensii]
MGWTWLLWLLVLLAVLALLVGLWMLVRLRALGRVVGSFSCAWRAAESQDWSSGVAVYGVERIDWYRILSLRPGPAARWRRSELVIEPGRRVLPGSAWGAMEVECHVGGDSFYLALEGDALAGLTSWLESSPPVDRGAA